jgi:hypothetical protein
VCSYVRVRARVGVNEIEIEATNDEIEASLKLLSQILDLVPSPSPQQGAETVSEEVSVEEVPPEIRVEKSDTLTAILTKLFRTPWGRTPRRLGEVRSALESYGMNYPKQTVAVALLRLAKSGRLRRFKSKEGEYVYTASTALLAEA